MKFKRMSKPAVCTLMTCIALSLATSSVQASSHREAPLIAGMPQVDASDFYMFRSYEAGREDYVTLIANYLPLQDAYGGPNYFRLDPQALYEIHIDNDGDAKEDMTFGFRFTNSNKAIALNVGGKDVQIPLTQAGPITQINDGTLNVRETYQATVTRGARRGNAKQSITRVGDGSAVFDKPVDNIGGKTFSGGLSYYQYGRQHVNDINIPGCNSAGKMFVGQRKDPFKVALGRVFDLINLNPLGAEINGNGDDLAAKNVTSIVMEIPIACLSNGTESVIGAWTTASVRQGRVVNPYPTGIGTGSLQGGPWAQVSRLGMPLVNELVIGLGDKDRFNSAKPKDDAQFADYVTHPTLPALIELLFPSAPAPTNFPRTDLVAAFLTGIKLADGTVVNQPANVVGAEMLRLNTAIAPTAQFRQNKLGVAGGDLAGFPNGRRPGDDVVDITLRVAMGALCTLTGDNDSLNVGCKPGDAPAGGAALTDGVNTDDSQFGNTFPYLLAPLAGAPIL